MLLGYITRTYKFLLKLAFYMIGFGYDILMGIHDGYISMFPGNRCINCKECLWKPNDSFLCNRFGFPINKKSTPIYTKTYKNIVLACYEFAKIKDILVPNNWIVHLAKDLRFRYFTKRNKK